MSRNLLYTQLNYSALCAYALYASFHSYGASFPASKPPRWPPSCRYAFLQESFVADGRSSFPLSIASDQSRHQAHQQPRSPWGGLHLSGPGPQPPRFFFFGIWTPLSLNQ